jgi:hypothetical protein
MNLHAGPLGDHVPEAASIAQVDDRAVVTSIAEAHLPPDVSDRWLALLRPAARLVPAAPGEPVVARWGGSPDLPAGTPWPEWEGRGPLSYLGEVDLTAVTAFELDIELPPEGRLLFFYFDGSVDDGAEVVGCWNPESLAGARVLAVPSTVPATRVSAPDGAQVYTERFLAGRLVMTYPGSEHPDLAAESLAPDGDRRALLDHPVNADAFTDELFERFDGPAHQLGGYADALQGPVEWEVAEGVLPGLSSADPRLAEEAARWELLLQIDSDDDMEWGDGGCLYWLARPSDLAAGDLGRISFTWQCF